MFLLGKKYSKYKNQETGHHHRYADVLCINHQHVLGLAPCTHEEADTHMLFHLEDAVQQGYNKVSIHTVDTDGVVLAVTATQHQSCGLHLALGRISNSLLLMRYTGS